ncbi:hypothetical protein TorRG33x02_037090 [Trema orientale]|uniref:Uncharacterized protein n=1 Tax=Trema orientale TaxID=63057 RepID=A0A2P5FS49_TREOI|nr:hypothetical protein TorRG33x02_037090 [Trema orientale]
MLTMVMDDELAEFLARSDDNSDDDGFMNIGLVINFVRQDDPPPENLALDSDNKELFALMEEQ